MPLILAQFVHHALFEQSEGSGHKGRVTKLVFNVFISFVVVSVNRSFSLT